ncbi:hypothetical protein [Gordonia polyisoprenivorans]|uniref:hypothetical protein n=1 Tax=Gordonia polyisoprenivorans TaxID=84595 RepID=UPI001AD70EF1|nr:hypothetical protein [Gordonia polyisoprenivorans]QTI67629.1 hypothetical protein J6U32_18885 [Gordonia polyisoprenivorans]
MIQQVEHVELLARRNSVGHFGQFAHLGVFGGHIGMTAVVTAVVVVLLIALVVLVLRRNVR